MLADYFRTLFEYDRWAWQRIFDRAEELSEAEYTSRQFNFGSVRSTLLHAIATEVAYGMRAQGLPSGPRLTEEELPTVVLLRKRWQEQADAQRAFLGGLSDEDAGRDVTYRGRNDQEATTPRPFLLAQLLNHSTQHRSEVAVALTEFGHSPGDLDVTLFLRENSVTSVGRG